MIPGVEPAPLQLPCEPLSGDSHRHLLGPLVEFAKALGYTVAFQSIPGATGGWCDLKAKQIVVDADVPATLKFAPWSMRSRTRSASTTRSIRGLRPR